MKKAVPWNLILSILLLAAVLALGVAGLRGADGTARKEGAARLEESIRRAAVSCYVTEGSYPDTVERLCADYDVYVDAKRYAVFYEIFASNIMPEVTVVTLEAAG